MSNELILVGLAFGVGYAWVNLSRRAMPLSLTEVAFGGVFGIPDNADTAPDAIHWEEDDA